LDTVVLRGGPRARGRQQGIRLHDSIRALSGRYEGRVFAGYREADVRSVLANMLRFVEDRFPEVLDELRGVAQGCELSFDEIARLNFGSAIITTLRSQAAAHGSCSCLAFRDTADGPVIGKNADLGADPECHYALKIVLPDEGHPYVGFGEVGGPWVEAAINAAGLAIGQASAPTQPGQDGYGMPILHSAHLVAQHTATVDDAVGYLADVVHAGKGSNLMLADAEGGLVALERGHDRQVVRTVAEDGSLCFANHFVSPEMRAVVVSRPDQGNSEGRVQRYGALVDEAKGERTIALIERAIADHGAPVGPCQHGAAGLHTRYACVLVPRRREMRLFRGPPCASRPQSYFI
jgi:isopenicillin-N N-acyltransferase-like protein